MRFDEGVLHDVKSVVGVAHDAEGQRVSAAIVPLKELAKGLLVAGFGLAHKLLFMDRLRFILRDRRIGEGLIHLLQIYQILGISAGFPDPGSRSFRPAAEVLV